MSHILKLFHVIHVVDDLAAAEALYERLFAPRYLFRRQYSSAEQRDASMMLFGDYVVEPMMPSREDGAAEKPVGRFHSRFGQHFHSVAFFVDDIVAVYERLRSHGVRIVGTGGAPLEGEPKDAIYTHPKDTGGLIEFMQPELAPYDVRLKPGWSDAYWRETHPLRLQYTSRMTIAVRDLEKARSLWEGVLDGVCFHEVEDSTARRAFLALSPEVVIELATPKDADSELAGELAANGEILHSVTFKVRDLTRASGFLHDVKIPFTRADEVLEIGVKDALGARYLLTDAPLPGDPRETQSGSASA